MRESPILRDAETRSIVPQVVDLDLAAGALARDPLTLWAGALICNQDLARSRFARGERVE
jgi:hypothetical protein